MLIIGMNPDSKFGPGRYDQVLIARILGLWERLYSVLHSSTTSHRMHADAFDLAVLIFCTRTTATQNRHGHICVPINQKSVDRLLSKLEKHRKRAKRAWLASAAHNVYWEYQGRWQKLLV